MSGGFPHSDIHGSKPIPGSPWLNAGYHVLHRLLLPRHPPNALFALDPIQKEQGLHSCKPPSGSKAYFPTSPAGSHGDAWSVVLDLEQYRFSGRSWDPPSATPYSGQPAILMFLSQRCQNLRPVGRGSASEQMRWPIGPASQDAFKTGGAYRDRTDDLLNANQALSQLS